MKSLLLALIAASVVSALQPAGNARLWSIDETRSFTGTNGSSIRTTVVAIDLTRANLRVLSVPFEVGKSPGSTELSVRGLAQTLAKQRAYQGKEWILVNGGFSSYQVDVPLGLLVVGGKVYSTLTRERTKQASSIGRSEYAEYRWSGVLCQSETDSRWKIIPAARYTPQMCRQALQAGPVPVEPISRVGIAATETKTDKSYVRTAVCIVSDSLMKIVVTRDETHLLPMALWMSKSESSGGLGCQSALNLSGETSSGMAISSPKRPLTFVGPGSFPLPSALMLESK